MKSTVLSSAMNLFRTHKKTILFSLGGLALAVGFFCMVYAILVTPSRQPYRTAYAQYKNVYNANIAVITAGSSLNASTATDSQFEKGITTVENTLTSLKSENTLLGKQAVLKKGEGKTLYTKFTKKLTTYISFTTDMLTSMKKVRPVMYACSHSMSDLTETAAGAASMQKCADTFAAITDIPSSDYTALVATIQPLYEKIAANITAQAALADPKGADATASAKLTAEQDDLLTELNTASTTFSTNINKHKEQVDITDAAKALDDYLSRKSRVF